MKERPILFNAPMVRALLAVMNDERYRKIMSDLGMPNSRSLLQALQQVANEVGQQSSEEITRLRAELADSRAECERLREALDYVIRDLEVRSHWKRGENKGVVDIGDGAYTQAKAALAGEVKP